MTQKKSVSHLCSSVANIKAVAFDAYGTIIDFTEPDFIATMAEICDRQGLKADAADLWRRFLRAALTFRSENHHQPVYRRYDEAWAIQFQHVFRRLNLPGDARAAAAYLKATGIVVGLLLNFGSSRVQVKRFARSK